MKSFASLKGQSATAIRDTLSSQYTRISDQPDLKEQKISNDAFCDAMIAFLTTINTPQSKREQPGLLYAHDFIKSMEAKDKEFLPLVGLANTHYWTGVSDEVLFMAKPNCTPSEALHAFFIGPTFTDCASGMQACILRAIEQMIGTKKFNEKFGSTLAPLIITPYIFDDPEQITDKTYMGYIKKWNPIHFLFDDIEAPEPSEFGMPEPVETQEENVLKGDILYIRGVDNYLFKHPTGDDMGWNVICTGKNTQGENLYLSFSPGMFGKSLTFQEIREHLIASYNEPPSFESLKLLNDSKSFINSQVEKDYVIDGITHIMRFNSKKLQQFCNPNQKAWHEVALTEELKKPSKKGVIENISSDNLKEDELSFSDLPGELKPYSTISKQFVHSLQEGKSMGLIFSGVDKIEESKLGAILAVTAAQYGHDVLYIDIKNILELLKSKVLSTEKEALIRDVIFKKSLIVLNGSPWNSPDAQFVLNYIVNNVLDKNQSLVLCSNYPLPLLSQMRCPPVRYDDPVTNAFLQITPTKQPIHESSSILFPKTTLQSNPQEKVNNELLKFLGVGDEKGIKKILSIAEETGIKDFVKQGASLEILIPSTDKTVLEYLKSLGKDQLVSELDEIIKKYKM